MQMILSYRVLTRRRGLVTRFLTSQCREQSAHLRLDQAGVIERAGHFRLEQLAKSAFQPMDRDLERAGVHAATGGQRLLIAARGIARQPRFDLLEKIGASLGDAFPPQRFQRARHDRQRPLPVEGRIGRQHARIGDRASFAGVGFIERDAFHTAAAFETARRLTVMRQKMFDCAEQIRTEAPAFLLGVGDGPARQDVREEILCQFARGFGIPKFVFQERGDRLVIGVAQFGQGAAAFRGVGFRPRDLGPVRRAKVLAGRILRGQRRRRLCRLTVQRNLDESRHQCLMCWKGKVTHRPIHEWLMEDLARRRARRSRPTKACKVGRAPRPLS
jgi:hypothetical protein